MIDLANFIVRPDEPREMVIIDPNTFEPMQNPDTGEIASLMLLGEDSQAYQKIHKEYLTAVVHKSRRNGGANYQFNPDQDMAHRLEKTAACIVGWKNIGFNGDLLVYSKEAAKNLLKSYPFIFKQAEVFIVDEGNFIGNRLMPSSNSASETSDSQ